MGIRRRLVTKDEIEKRKKFRRSIVTTQVLKIGTIIYEKDITVKRPGTGIPPEDSRYVIGRTLKKDIGEGEVLKWEDLA